MAVATAPLKEIETRSRLGVAAAWLVGTIASGTLLFLALPPHTQSWLGWIALVPAILVCRGRGFAFGFASGVLACVWASWLAVSGFLLPPNVIESDPGWTYGGFALFGATTGLALGTVSASEALTKRPWLAAVWAVLFEALLLVYIPAHLALTQSRSTAMLELASWLGVWGVSYLVWLCNFGIAALLCSKRIALSVAIIGLGAIASLSLVPAEEGSLAIGMVQTRTKDVEELAALNREAGALGAHVVVWPELAASVSAIAGDTRELRRLARQPGQPPFVTSFEDELQPKPRNTAAVFSFGGESKRYAKRKQFSAERFARTPGKEPLAVPVAGTQAALNICFDSCFSAISRESAALQGVGVILAPTQDPETPFGVVQAIHAAYTPFRAAESGVPIVRADTTAYSLAVDARGREIWSLPLGEGKVGVARVKPGQRWTLAKTLGDWFLYGCSFFGALGLSRGFVARRRSQHRSA